MSILFKFLKSVEGLELHPYPDSGGKITVGYGHVVRPWEKFKYPITIDQAESLLITDAENAVSATDKLVRIPLNEHERAAVASWIFNLGARRVMYSNTLAALNRGDKEKFLDMLMMWNKVTLKNGKKVPVNGLTNRRAAEVQLFRGKWGKGEET